MAERPGAEADMVAKWPGAKADTVAGATTMVALGTPSRWPPPRPPPSLQQRWQGRIRGDAAAGHFLPAAHRLGVRRDPAAWWRMG